MKQNAGMVSEQSLQTSIQTFVQGSASFSFAARLLPKRSFEAAAIYYRFCRVADDAVDESADPRAALHQLKVRVERVFGSAPLDDADEKAWRHLINEHGLPPEAFSFMLEGFAWDLSDRHYGCIDDLEAYCVRVASTVGVVMTRVFGRRAQATLARAADLGIAMQLSNIARDVAEDAARQRVYLPEAWLRDEDLSREAILNGEASDDRVFAVIRRLLRHADFFYERAKIGIPELPLGARFAVRAASLIYQDIGAVILSQGSAAYRRRARTTKLQKLRRAIQAFGVLFWAKKENIEPPQPAAKALVEAVSECR